MGSARSLACRLWIVGLCGRRRRRFGGRGEVEWAFLAATEQQHDAQDNCHLVWDITPSDYNPGHSHHGLILMTDLEYLALAEGLLQALEIRCDAINEATDADIDVQRVGNMVTLVFPNRSQIVVNLQKPLHEVWLAARQGGYHYRWSGLAWLDKDQVDFHTRLSQCASDQAGLPLVFQP